MQQEVEALRAMKELRPTEQNRWRAKLQIVCRMKRCEEAYKTAATDAERKILEEDHQAYAMELSLVELMIVSIRENSRALIKKGGNCSDSAEAERDHSRGSSC